MDKASFVLASLTAPSLQLPAGYQRLSAAVDHPPADQEINQYSSLVQPPLPEPRFFKLVPEPIIGRNECRLEFTTRSLYFGRASLPCSSHFLKFSCI